MRCVSLKRNEMIFCEYRNLFVKITGILII